MAGRQIITIADWRKSGMDSWSRVTRCSPRPQLRQHDIYPYRIKMICILFLKDVKIKHVDGERTVMKRSYNGKWISYWLRIPKKCTMYNATKRDFLTTNDRVIRGVCCPFCAHRGVSTASSPRSIQSVQQYPWIQQWQCLLSQFAMCKHEWSFNCQWREMPDLKTWELLMWLEVDVQTSTWLRVYIYGLWVDIYTWLWVDIYTGCGE